jgi:hypothetical protein
VYKYHIYSRIVWPTKKIVLFIEKYLHDYKNSHIFVMKDDKKRRNGATAQRHNGTTAQRHNGRKEVRK